MDKEQLHQYMNRSESEPRSALFSQLRPDLVRDHETGRRHQQNSIVCPLTWTHPRPRSALQFARVCQSLSVSIRFSDESASKVFRMVKILIWFFYNYYYFLLKSAHNVLCFLLLVS